MTGPVGAQVDERGAADTADAFPFRRTLVASSGGGGRAGVRAGHADPDRTTLAPNGPVAIGIAKGEVVVYEFDLIDGAWAPVADLTYPNQAGRFYYKAGDLVRTAKLPRHLVEKLFPELKTESPSGMQVFGQLALGLLGEFPEDIECGYVLKRIEPATRRLAMVGFIKLENNIIELEKTSDLSLDTFGSDLRVARAFRSTVALGEAINSIAAMAYKVISSIGFGAASAGGKKIAKMTLKAALKKTGREAAKKKAAAEIKERIRTNARDIAIASSRAFGKDFGIEYQKQLSLAGLASAASDGAIVRKTIEPACVAGVAGAAKAMVDELVGPQMALLFSSDGVLRTFRQKLEAWMMEFVTSKLLQAVFIDAVASVVKTRFNDLESDTRSANASMGLVVKSVADEMGKWLKSSIPAQASIVAGMIEG